MSPLLWLARVQFETQYQYFETHVAGPVSGLGTGALVRLNGIEVGRVAKIALDPKDPKLVTLLLQVRDGIEIHSDAVASIESQGLTGVSYVEISGGTLGSPLLIAAEGQKYPQIASRPSSLQEVFDNAPELLSRLLIIADRLESVLDDKNRGAIAETLVNIRDTTGMLRSANQGHRPAYRRWRHDHAQSGGRQRHAEKHVGESGPHVRQGRWTDRVGQHDVRARDETGDRSRLARANQPTRPA